MLTVLTGTQMKNIDKKTIEDLKIPGLILMENAGRAVFEEVVSILDETEDEHENVLVICGKGNNGGDGFVAARHLIQEGVQTYVLSAYPEEVITGEALANLNALKNFTDILYYDELDNETLQDLISVSTVVVDAILGTGINTEIHGHIKDLIETINAYSEGYVLSVDVPSGIDANTGKIMGTSVIADYTVTFYAPKLGILIHPGADLAGEVQVYDIGIPNTLITDPEYNINLITQEYISAALPMRPDNSNKATFGRVCCIAGSFGMTGAAYFASLASLKAGAGFAVLATAESLIPMIAPLCPDIVMIPLKETEAKSISHEATSMLLESSQKCNTFLIGPGIGNDPSTVDFLFAINQKLVDRGIKAVFDADALTNFSSRESFTLPLGSIITPHPKELARLMKTSLEEVMNDRIGMTREAAQRFNTIVVLKGSRTVIAEPDGTVYINPTGNSALAKAGTGDVLAGMIAGFLAQGVEPIDAAIIGTYLHGLAGEIASENLTEYSVNASDLLDYIPDALKEVC